MSGLSGVWNLDSRPISSQLLEQVSHAISHCGPYGYDHKIRGSFGITHQHLRSSVQSPEEPQPLDDPHAGILIALDGRLDSRQELFSLLEHPKETLCKTSDVSLIHQAYLQRGLGFLPSLKGDFAIALFDSKNQNLHLIRDPLGVRTLYFSMQPDPSSHGASLTFCSEIKGILAQRKKENQPVKIDPEGIFNALFWSSDPYETHQPTCFKGVSAVPPSCVVSVTASGETQTRKYWDFDTEHRVEYSNFEHCVEAFGEIFGRAVERRLQSPYPVAISVSGGLDSSAIYSKALKLKAGSKIIPISYIGERGSLANEETHLSALEKHVGEKVFRIPPNVGMDILAGAQSQVRQAEAPVVDLLWQASHHILSVARQQGARTLLTGTWGDQFLFSQDHLIDLVKEGSWNEIREHLKQYALWHDGVDAKTFHRIFYKAALRAYAPKPLVKFLKMSRAFLGLAPIKQDRIFTKNLRQHRSTFHYDRSFRNFYAKSIYVEARSRSRVNATEVSSKASALHGIESSFPFLDRDLISFLIAIPGEYQNFQGIPRGLLRASMRADLPKKISQRRDKGDFTSTISSAINKQYDQIEELFTHNCRAVESGLIEPKRLGRTLHRGRSTANRQDGSRELELAHLIGLECWLREYLT